jgi:lipopolysaccharide export system permease protein
MLIIDRYLTRRFLKNFFGCLLVFLLLYIVIDVLSNLQDILRNHPPALKVVELYLYSLPLIISQTTPVAALLAVLFALGGLNQSNEIIAMRTSGLSIGRIIRPYLTFGIMTSLCLLVMNETVTPQAQRMSKVLKQYYIDNITEAGVENPVENVAVYGFNNRLFFMNKLYPKSHRIEGLTILEHDDRQNVTAKVFAEKAVWRHNRWVLYQCFIYRMGDGQKIKGEPLYFTDTPLKIEETPEDFLRQNIPVESMNIKELAGYISRLPEKNSSATITRLWVDLFEKTSFPFTTFIVILIGIPSAIVVRGRAVAFSSIGLCIGISFLFYVLFAVSLALGKSGAVPPFVAAWMSHVGFGAVALYLIKRIP